MKALAVVLLCLGAQSQDMCAGEANGSEETSLLQMVQTDVSGELRRDSSVRLVQEQMKPEQPTLAVPVQPSQPREQNKTASLKLAEHSELAQPVTHWEYSGLVSSWIAMNMPLVFNFWQTLSLVVVVNALCMIGNVLVQVSPYPQAKEWEAKKDTGDSDAAPYVSICYCGWQWCFYGIFAWLVTGNAGFLILVKSNFLGAVLGMHYTAAFYRNCICESSSASLFQYLKGVAFLIALQVCGLMTLSVERALFLSGLVSSFCSFAGACSMLVTVPTVVRSKDASSINGGLVCAYFGSALTWCACGFLLGDMLVMGPNVVSAISSGLCMWLKFQYSGQGMGMALPINPSAAAIARKNAALNAHFQPVECLKDAACLSQIPELVVPEVRARSDTGSTD